MERPDQIEALFKYVRSIAQTCFSSDFCQFLFPQALSTRKEIALSKIKQISEKIPLKQIATTTQSDKLLNLVDAFDRLKGSTRTNLNTILALTDFCILYSSLVIIVSKNDKNTEAALFF